MHPFHERDDTGNADATCGAELTHQQASSSSSLRYLITGVSRPMTGTNLFISRLGEEGAQDGAQLGFD